MKTSTIAGLLLAIFLGLSACSTLRADPAPLPMPVSVSGTPTTQEIELQKLAVVSAQVQVQRQRQAVEARDVEIRATAQARDHEEQLRTIALARAQQDLARDAQAGALVVQYVLPTVALLLIMLAFIALGALGGGMLIQLRKLHLKAQVVAGPDGTSILNTGDGFAIADRRGRPSGLTRITRDRQGGALPATARRLAGSVVSTIEQPQLPAADVQMAVAQREALAGALRAAAGSAPVPQPVLRTLYQAALPSEQAPGLPPINVLYADGDPEETANTDSDNRQTVATFLSKTAFL
jgi:hypothetical protein